MYCLTIKCIYLFLTVGPKAGTLIVHDGCACQRVHLHRLFLLDNGLSTNCLILLVGWEESQIKKQDEHADHSRE